MVLLAAALDGGVANAKDEAPKDEAPKILTGVIKKFECGDNCYLTIETGGGEETGLCEAKPCIPWFENQKMPKKFVGRKVKVTTGIGKQVDGNYDVVGHTLSFKKLEFVK
jgi:hypothetical protein